MATGILPPAKYRPSMDITTPLRRKIHYAINILRAVMYIHVLAPAGPAFGCHDSLQANRSSREFMQHPG